MEKEKKILSIKTKILFIVIASLLIISFSISYVSYVRARAFLKEDIYRHITSLLNTTKRWIENNISSQENLVLLFSENPIVKEVSSEIKLLFEDVSDQGKFFKEAREIFFKRKESEDVIFDNYIFFVQKLLKFTNLYSKRKGYENILLIDTHSGYIYFEDSMKEDFGTSLFKDQYRNSPLAKIFHKARKLKKNEFIFSDFTFYSPYGKKPIAFLAAPIYKNSKPDSVCVFVITLSTLKKIFSQIERGYADFDIHISGEDHYLRMGTDVTEKDILKKKMDVEFVEKALSGKSGVATIEEEGVEKIVAYAPIKIFDRKWAIIGEIPESIIFSSASKLRNEIFIISILLAFLFSIFIYFHILGIVEPIKRLTSLVIRITKKELPLDTDIKIKTGDEIEILSKHFNDLIHILKEEMDTITKLVNILDGEAANLENIAEKEKDLITSQAANITELASSMEEFSKTMGSIVAINEKALKEFEKLKESAMKNRDAQKEAMEGMNNLKDQIKYTFELFDKIIKMNEDIRGISDIIDSVTEQIKIIAFNASLEAARAGEAGRGFSVIAAQIRELLENISKQNIEIKKLIDENSRNVSKISEGTERISYFLEIEENNVLELNNFIESVLNLIEKNEEFISSISLSQKEQKIATEEFTISMRESKKKIEESKKLAEEILESVAVLKEIVNELVKIKDKIG